MSDATPDISVVVPTFDRPERLRRCLAALGETDLARDRFEVVVVDDGGPTPLDAIVAEAEPAISVRLLRQENAGPAAARNRGAAEARGRFLAFTDDDCRPAPDWLPKLLAVLEEGPDALAGGRTVNALRGNVCSEASQVLVTFLYDWYAARPSGPMLFTSNNFAMSADAFADLGGFDTTFRLAAGEDRDFCDRWRASGRPLVYASDAVVRHEHALGPRSFWRQHFNYGRGAYDFHTRRAAREAEPVRFESFKFYGGLLTAGCGRSPLWALPVVTGLLGVSQVANAAGFFAERARRRAGW